MILRHLRHFDLSKRKVGAMERLRVKSLCTLLFAWLAAGAALANLAPSSIRAGEPQEPSRTVQKTVLRQLVSSKPKLREAAVATLEEYKTASAARLLVEHGLTSQFADVRHASYRTLLSESEIEEVCDVLVDRARKALEKRTADSSTCGMLGVLLASESAPVQQSVRELLDLAARQPGFGWEVLVSLADELGLEGDDRSLKSLVKLSEQPLFGNSFASRRAIVHALMRIERPEAIDALISILRRTPGEVRADIGRYLTVISGQPHAVDAARWESWWKANREMFSSRALRPAPVYGPLYASAPARYYGLPIYAQRLAFVLDTSGSMSGARLDAGRRELLQAIASLPDGVWFNVLTFNQGVMPWRAQLSIASPANKAEAAAFVMSQYAVGATWSYDALEAAMSFDVESIYFLTDGEPCGGTVSDPTTIVATITRLNHARRLTINSIGIGSAGGPFDGFLQALAKSNYGEYRRVGQ